MREAARTKNASEDVSNVTDTIADLTVGDDDISNSIGSEHPQDGSQATSANSTACSDGLLIDDAVIEQILDSVVSTVQASLSSELVERTGQEVISEKSNLRAQYHAKRDSEIAGLQAAISNAIDKGSCPAEKISLVSKVRVPICNSDYKYNFCHTVILIKISNNPGHCI